MNLSTLAYNAKNVYVSVESVIDKLKNNEANKVASLKRNHNAAARKPHVAYPSNDNRGWEEYDNISNMPTL